MRKWFQIPRLISPGVRIVLLCVATLPVPAPGAPAGVEKARLACEPLANARFQIEGVLGRRVEANVDQWLLRAPRANPGLLEMFRLRDRKPEPNLVPWAGEFVGKYLLSAIQALRLSTNAALAGQARRVVSELIACQAEDGYLGPFPKAVRLKAHWDLWGHYHCLQALLLWHELTGDAAALAAARRAADLVCRTFLDGSLRVFDAGSHEMNMAILHGLGQLHHVTGEPRYLRMMHEIEKDWERAGDYLRTGLAGLEFFETPRPRWESLHDLQGLLELHRITGEARYRAAFEHHWRSIARWDRHNTGGFSSGEQATGNPWAPGAIETCCVVAWMALSADMLRLAADPRVADELELATFNAAAGAQHPSGRWWTYNTPMDGVREASAHSIVFQARAGTPELNCCSVNGPRALGLLGDWMLMTDDAGLLVNGYAPGEFRGRLRNGVEVTLRCRTDYPVSGRVRMNIEAGDPRPFAVRFRIPAWAGETTVSLNDGPPAPAKAGRYHTLERRWDKGDAVELRFDMRLRFVTGDREAAGKVSLYRGPLLLAWDQRLNDHDEIALPVLDLSRLAEARLLDPESLGRMPKPREPRGTGVPPVASAEDLNQVLQPWLLLEVPASSNRALRLCDFASAGAAGTRYRSWLTAADCPPPPVVTRAPADGATLPVGPVLFKWTGPRRTNAAVSEYRLTITESAEFTSPVTERSGLRSNRVVLDLAGLPRLEPRRPYFWKVTARNTYGETESVGPPAWFAAEPALPPGPASTLIADEGPDEVLVRASLRGDPKPEFGQLKEARGFASARGPRDQPDTAIELDGKSQLLRYALEEFPEEDYTLLVRVRFNALPTGRLGQVFSAWCAPMDDPLRVCVDRGRLCARIEAGQGYGTEGVAVTAGRWYHVAAVKAGTRLTLFVDGRAGPAATVPVFVRSSARDFAVGGNPHYSGDEFLAAQLADLSFFARALPAEEIQRRAKTP